MTDFAEQSRPRFCRACHRKTEHLREIGCVACAARNSYRQRMRADDASDLYRPHGVAECLADDEQAIKQRLATPHAPPAPLSIEQILSGEGCE